MKGHYDRTHLRTSVADRLWSKVAKSEGCWTWTGYIATSGYGRLSIPVEGRRGTVVYAHRAAYEIAVGPIPTGLEIDHLCRNRACVNPDHLEPVTGIENKRRAAAAITHCANGHEFTEENTYRRPGTGARQCVTCRAEVRRRRRG